MRKAITLPAAALISASVVVLATVGPVSANPAPGTATPSAHAVASRKVAPRKAEGLPIRARYIRRYHLSRKDLRQIALAKRWAATPKARSVVRCESGGNYRINTGNGYYGAWQFASGTWLGVGGGRYARLASSAPRFAQDHMAWRLWKRSGWGPWACA